MLLSSGEKMLLSHGKQKFAVIWAKNVAVTWETKCCSHLGNTILLSSGDKYFLGVTAQKNEVVHSHLKYHSPTCALKYNP